MCVHTKHVCCTGDHRRFRWSAAATHANDTHSIYLLVWFDNSISLSNVSAKPMSAQCTRAHVVDKNKKADCDSHTLTAPYNTQHTSYFLPILGDKSEYENNKHSNEMKVQANWWHVHSGFIFSAFVPWLRPLNRFQFQPARLIQFEFVMIVIVSKLNRIIISNWVRAGRHSGAPSHLTDWIFMRTRPSSYT